MRPSRALIASDGSDLAIDAARRALALISPEIELTVLTVAPVMAAGADALMVGPVDGLAVVPAGDALADARAAIRERAESELARTVEALGRPADTRIVEGDPGPTICDVANDEGFDLVVVGSHGSGFLRRALVGSVSHHVLHHAHCPVLVIRSAPAADDA